jgi:hypothetical protein
MEKDRMSVRREVDESGFLLAPWDVGEFGRLMGSTGTLIERSDAYPLPLELARGKVNQLRAQAAEWQGCGLQIPEPLAENIHAASVAFGRAVSHESPEQSRLAQTALELAYGAARDLVGHYMEEMFQARLRRQNPLDTAWGCRLTGHGLDGTDRRLLASFCNAVGLSFAWKEIEPAEGEFHWDAYDALLQWAQSTGLRVTAGPLIDFSPSQLPDWLWLWRGDLSNIASLACDYVSTVLRRYGDRIRCWQLSAASNLAAVLGLGEEELLWLTARLVETARQVDAKLELIVGIAQPWGEYMAKDDRTHSPFIFADTLIRAGLNLAALDLEIVMGVSPRGTYCRDLLEVSRLTDLYSLLGVPLRITLGCPSSSQRDPLAEQELAVNAGYWSKGWDTAAQTEWTSACASLVLCKPYVQGMHWTHWSDSLPHQFPMCGLVDGSRRPKPALAKLENIRRRYLE